ncbi:hypothetical protein NX059_002740 [Plenodomus lindquistii]|nr:hypothetical protein NX059_002740 [Plenodomus lindquistii]
MLLQIQTSLTSVAADLGFPTSLPDCSREKLDEILVHFQSTGELSTTMEPSGTLEVTPTATNEDGTKRGKAWPHSEMEGETSEDVGTLGEDFSQPGRGHAAKNHGQDQPRTP